MFSDFLRVVRAQRVETLLNRFISASEAHRLSWKLHHSVLL